MYLLVRNVSPYTAQALFIGVFNTFAQAEIAKSEYIHKIRADELVDPWKKQAYKKVDLESDIKIVSDLLEDISQQLSVVFLVAEHNECFGQVEVTPKGLFDSFKVACSYAEKMSESGSKNWPCWHEISELEVGKLYYNKLKKTNEETHIE